MTSGTWAETILAGIRCWNVTSFIFRALNSFWTCCALQVTFQTATCRSQDQKSSLVGTYLVGTYLVYIFPCLTYSCARTIPLVQNGETFAIIATVLHWKTRARPGWWLPMFPMIPRRILEFWLSPKCILYLVDVSLHPFPALQPSLLIMITSNYTQGWTRGWTLSTSALRSPHLLHFFVSWRRRRRTDFQMAFIMWRGWLQ